MEDEVFSAYAMNLALYNEGYLCGIRLGFPIAHDGGTSLKEAVDGALCRIRVDGKKYKEYFITGYKTDVEGLAECLGEHEDIFMLDSLARRLAEMDCSRAQFEAMLKFGKSTGSIEGLTNLAGSADSFCFMPEVANDYQLGYEFAVNSGLFTEELKNIGMLADYIDYEAYGRGIRLKDNGIYTGNGYISLKDEIRTCFDSSKDKIPKYG